MNSKNNISLQPAEVKRVRIKQPLPKEPMMDKIRKVMDLNRSTDPEEQREFIKERRLKIFTVLGLALVAKVFHLIKVLDVLYSDLELYRDANPAILVDYPPSEGTTEKDDSTDALLADCYKVMAQYIVLMLVNMVAMLITKID